MNEIHHLDSLGLCGLCERALNLSVSRMPGAQLFGECTLNKDVIGRHHPWLAHRDAVRVFQPYGAPVEFNELETGISDEFPNNTPSPVSAISWPFDGDLSSQSLDLVRNFHCISPQSFEELVMLLQPSQPGFALSVEVLPW